MSAYLQRLMPSMKAAASVFLVIAGFRFASNLIAGSVEGGDFANIVMRVAAILALTALVSFIVAASVDWNSRRGGGGL